MPETPTDHLDGSADTSDRSVPLADQLRALTAGSGATDDQEQVLARELARVSASGAAPGLPFGHPAPLFALPDATGRTVSLNRLLAHGPVVVTFYRGSWCPYCNLELRAWQRHLDRLTAAGASLVAISPQRPTDAAPLAERHHLGFPVLSDEDQRVIAAYRLRFTLPPELRRLYEQAWGLDLGRHNADGSWTLPVPGTFVVDRGARIAYAFASADYRVRAEPADVLAALARLVRPSS